MNKNALKVLAATSLIALSNAAFAQAASAPPAAPSPAKLALINKLIQLQQPGVENIGRMLLQQPVGNLMQGAGQALQQMPADKREAAAKAIEVEVRKFVDETVPLMRERGARLSGATWTPLLDERFTEDELKQTIAWLESPTSKKYQQLGTEMQQALAQKMVADTRTTVETRLKTLEQTIAKQLGLTLKPPAAAASGAKK